MAVCFCLCWARGAILSQQVRGSACGQSMQLQSTLTREGRQGHIKRWQGTCDEAGLPARPPAGGTQASRQAAGTHAQLPHLDCRGNQRRASSAREDTSMRR